MIKIVGKDVHGETEEKLDGAINELSRNIREIQEAVMSMRMLPMSFAFNRFPRVVRDLADKLGKDIELTIVGGATEIDKGLIEKLVDPLTHLIRNSIDHGVEMPDVRANAGKPTQGNVVLSAEQRGGSINITITDDGAGLNRERILSKAMSSGLDVSEDMPDDQVWPLIFEAGFSTADAVTDVSGRGVGMDVVRRNIESIGGIVEIESRQNEGSVFRIRLPLTLAIVDGMCVAVSEQTFVIPLTNIIESMQPTQEQLKTMQNDHLLWVRGEYWPLVALHQIMGIEGALTDPASAIVVLVETSRRRFGILVDALEGQQQVVIKSLEQHYKRVPGVAGATIMGDGGVAMILDVESIASQVNNIAPQEVSIAS
jgi:two-component system chemotaxis sensor kinase CheA